MIEFYEAAANIMHPCRVIGVAVNGQRFADDAKWRPSAIGSAAASACPACDVIRQGPERLIEAVIRLRRDLEKSDGEKELGAS